MLKHNGKVQWCCSLCVKAPENAKIFHCLTTSPCPLLPRPGADSAFSTFLVISSIWRVRDGDLPWAVMLPAPSCTWAAAPNSWGRASSSPLARDPPAEG